MSASRVVALRKKIKELNLELKKSVDELHELERQKNIKNVKKFVGKYLVEKLSKSFERYYYVLGVNDDDSSGRSLEALSVLAETSWFVVEKYTLYPDDENYYQITSEKFFEKVREIKPFLDFLIDGLKTHSKKIQ